VASIPIPGVQALSGAILSTPPVVDTPVYIPKYPDKYPAIWPAAGGCEWLTADEWPWEK